MRVEPLLKNKKIDFITTVDLIVLAIGGMVEGRQYNHFWAFERHSSTQSDISFSKTPPCLAELSLSKGLCISASSWNYLCGAMKRAIQRTLAVRKT